MRRNRYYVTGAILIAGFALWMRDAVAMQPEEQALHPPRRWFEPHLTVDKSPVCATFLRRAIAGFRSNDSRRVGLWEQLQVINFYQAAPESGVTWQSYRTADFTEHDGRMVHATFETIPGCGGACEGQRVYLSLSPLREQDTAGGDPANPHGYTWKVATTSGESLTVLRAPDGDHYLFDEEGEENPYQRVFRVSDAGSPACQIEMMPSNLRNRRDPALRSALAVLDDFAETVDRLAPQEGGFLCGTSNTEYRWWRRRKYSYDIALVRPWAVDLGSDPSSENSWGDYSRIGPQLAQWSLRGLFEYHQHAAYLAQLDRTTVALAAFYKDRFGWNAATARILARRALTQAVSNGMGFYVPEPYSQEDETLRSQEDETLRKAILSRKPIDRVRRLDVEPDGASAMLDLAVIYPLALEYLLQKGADPNNMNGFGKTALMYAAQYNQIESVKILLQHEANPNAATFSPEDNCYYRLLTTGMTPLHYAVRYGSANLVDTLLDAGAAPENEAINGGEPETPFKWLRKYSNRHLSAADVRHLEQRLRVPSGAQH